MIDSKKLSLVAGVLGAGLLGGPALAQNDISANAIIPGCRDLIAVARGATLPGVRLQGAAECGGIFMTLAYVSAYLNTRATFCRPSGVTRGQTVEIAMREIEAHPEQWNQPFIDLAIGAMQKVWPCR